MTANRSTLSLKKWLAPLTVAFLIGAIAGAEAAVTPFAGGDDFNDNAKDATKWGADTAPGVGVLTETNGRLEYTSSPVIGSINFASRPWVLNQGVYDRSWFVQMDASIGFSSPATGTFHGGNISLGVLNDAVTNDSANLQLTDFNGVRSVQATVLRNGITQLSQAVSATNNALVTLRIAFDATAQTLSFFWDSDGPANGLALDLITSISIGSGIADWGMGAGSLFDARIFGAAGEIAIESGQLVADNFIAATEPLPEPGTLALLGAAAAMVALRRRNGIGVT